MKNVFEQSKTEKGQDEKINEIRDQLFKHRQDIQQRLRTIKEKHKEISLRRFSKTATIHQQIVKWLQESLSRLNDFANGQDLTVCGALKIILAYEFPFLGPETCVYYDLKNENEKCKVLERVSRQVQNIATEVISLIESKHLRIDIIDAKLEEFNSEFKAAKSISGWTKNRLQLLKLLFSGICTRSDSVEFLRDQAKEKIRDTLTYEEEQAELDCLKMANTGSTYNIHANNIGQVGDEGTGKVGYNR
jgi:hypothetical protein